MIKSIEREKKNVGGTTHIIRNGTLPKPVHLLFRRTQFVPISVHIPVQLVKKFVLLTDLRVDGESEVLLTL